MATHSDIERILCERLKKVDTPNGCMVNPICSYLCGRLKKTDTPNHQAIALVGDWGIGKTFLWQNFYEKNKTSLHYKKYAYISLFGISSLEELKLKIATEIVSTKSGKGLKMDTMPFFKKLRGLFSTTRFSDMGVSVSIGSSVMSGLVLSSLKDTLVCLDDLERRGKNLPIDEVMGLVNYLTQEKNCSVVCLLNRGEIKDEQYDNYKEKVFTYELIIDDSLELVLEKFPKDCHDVVKRFYDIFGIKNVRFYEKVLERYKSFIDKLNESKLSAISKESILFSFLLLMAYDMMPKVMDYAEQEYVGTKHDNQNSNRNKDRIPKRNSVVEKARSLTYQLTSSFRSNQWHSVIYNFICTFEINDITKTLIDKNLFSETRLANERELNKIIEEYDNLELLPDFSGRLAESIKKNLHNGNSVDVECWCNILEGMGAKEKAIKIKKLKEMLKERSESAEEQIPKDEQIIQFFIAICQNKEPKISEQFISQMTKEKLRAVIWADLSGLKYGNRRNFIKSVITCYLLDNEQKEKFRVWAVEILQEEAEKANPEEKYVINTYLEWTENLAKDT